MSYYEDCLGGRTFYIECLGLYGWYFIRQTSDLQKAIDMAACERQVRNEPTRVAEKYRGEGL
jgi:hypothetical protein